MQNSSPSFVQAQSILGNISVSEVDGNAFLSWQIVAGSTCNGIQIFRSTDSLSFTQIWDIPGICGNISEPQNYNFTDNSPEKNKINYYRLELGSYGFSQIVSVEIADIENSGYQVRPNPISSDFKIYFDNSKRKVCQLLIFSLSGIQMFSESTDDGYFQLGGDILKSGIYLFTISVDGNLPSVNGKLIFIN